MKYSIRHLLLLMLLVALGIQGYRAYRDNQGGDLLESYLRQTWSQYYATKKHFENYQPQFDFSKAVIEGHKEAPELAKARDRFSQLPQRTSPP